MSTTRETLKAIHERGDLLPWLNGETDYYFNGEKDYLGYSLNFDSNPEKYTFRPKPAPPKLRPWNEFELKSHRDDWFRRKTGCGAMYHPVQIGPGARIEFDHCIADADELCRSWEHLAADGQTWLPCGTVE
jgi:hypothetical protein